MFPALTYGAGTVAALLLGYSRWQTRRIERRHPPRGRFVEIGGGRLHYTERLPAGEPRATVLLLHGASGNESDLMLPLGDKLADRGFRVIAIDRPGYGWSDRPRGRADAQPERQVELIVRGLRRMGIQRAIVLGHSLAGVHATCMALNHQGFTQGLVLVAPVTHPWPGGDINWYHTPASLPVVGRLFTELVTLPAGQLALDKALAGVFSPQAPPADYDSRTGIQMSLRPASFRANAQDVSGIFAAVTRLSPRYGDICAPTAIVTGDCDSVVLTRIHSFRSSREIPGAKLILLRGVGHSPHWSQPDSVIDAIDDVTARGLTASDAGAAGSGLTSLHV